MQIIIDLDVGGAELMLKRLVEAHCGSPRYKHTVVSLTGLGVLGPKLREAGVEVFALEMQSMLDAPVTLARLWRLIRRTRPDVVQTWMYHADLLGGIAARLAGVRAVMWGIRTTDVRSGNSGWTRLLMRACALLSRLVPASIVCAADAARRAHEAAGYDARRMKVVPNGFARPDPGLYVLSQREARLRCGLSGAGLVIGTVGRFNEAKDHQNFVRAASIVARHDPELRFLMVGRDVTPANQVLAGWIAEGGVADRFVLLGERPDVSVCLAAMDVFCLSSRSEGFPNVLGEAMAMGVPCVTTDVGDAAVLVADTAIVVPRQNAVLLAAGIAKVLALAPPARAHMGLAGRNRIEAEFSMERTRERFEEIYEQLAGEGKYQCVD